MKKLLSLSLFCWLLAASAWAQSVTIGTGTSASSTSSGPVYVSSSGGTFLYSRQIAIYKASEIIAAGASGGNLQKIRWYKADAQGYSNNDATFKIYIKPTTATEHTTTPVTWATEVTGATLVYSSTTQNLNTTIGWQEFVLNTPFFWDGSSNLEIFVDFYRPGTATGAIAWQYTTVTNANAITGSDVTTGAPATVARNSNRPNIQLEFGPAGPNDIGISAITSPASPAQPNVSLPIEVTLRNNGTNAVTSGTISWKIDNGAFTNYTWNGNLASQQTAQVVIGNYTFTPGTYTVTAKTSLPNGVADSGPLNDEKTKSVVVCQALSGNYTINSAGTTSGTNFKTFGDATARLGQCGVSGPVTFTVTPGSGPYNELVTLTPIPYASATNRITFEGNGNTITSTTGSTDAIIKMDGADYVKFNNFKLKMDGASTVGSVVNMFNGANFNTISNSTLSVSTTATGTINTVSINGSGNNLIENDSIIGGYYSVRVEDVANGTLAVNNQVRNNIIRDNYVYNIYLANTTGTIIEGNDISRPTRTNGSSFYGIYVGGTFTSGTIISKNRIHNTHDAATSLTGSVYAIYSTGDAVTGSENIVKNNLIYNINNTAGFTYALYNVGADGTYYYHNTIALDQANITGTFRGFFLSSVTTNVKFNNNIITLNGSGTTTKHAIYVSSTTSVFESNNNDLYIYPGAGAAFVGYYSGDKTTLADWKTANSNAYDQNSVSVDPRFENRAGGNLKPTSFFVNNVGKPLPAVTDDITGATRSTTTPDLGAYEFTPPAKDVAVTAITTLNSDCGKTNQETVTIIVTNMGTDPQSNIPVQFSTNGGTTWSTPETIPGPIAPGATITFTFTAKANLSTPGTYNFQARTQLAGDAIPSNDVFTKIVDALPTITSYPYSEGFENSDGGWKASGSFSSWALGTPAKPVINSAGSGTKSWVTSLTGTYNINEQSQVISPCLNFSTLQKPLMEMKVWWSSQTSFDGAVLQSSTDNGQTWLNVGAFGDTDWYNDNSINGGPGGQAAGTTSTAEGWSGTGTASSNGWITVKHALPGLQLKPNVRLRIAFGADASTQNDGFAFDDVKIYDTPQNDMGVIGISSIASGCGLSNAQTVTVTVRNFGLASQSNIPVSFSLDGVTFVPNETIPGPVAPNATATYTFTAKANLSTPGTYNFTACTRLTGDGDASNNCRSQEVRSIPTITTYPYFQDFENGDGGWTASGTNSSWAYGTPNKAVIKGASSGTKAFVTSLTGQYNNSENSVVIGPCFNFSTLTNPQLDMKVWWHSEFSMDGAVLQYSTDNGATWNNVGFNGDPNNWYNDATINGAPGGQPAATAEGWTGHLVASSSNGWVRIRHALSGLGGQANVKLRIAFGSNATTVYDGFAFDDVLIYEKPANDALVTAISSFNSGCGIGQETVTVTIENAGTTPITNLPVSFQVAPQSGAPLTAVNETYTGTIAPGAVVTYTFTGKANLSNAGINTVTARTNLAGDQVPQNDATSVKQETIPTVTTYPYMQDFENGDGGWKASGTNSTWALGTPNKTVIKGAASGTNAWVTSLAGQYNPSENSQVLGPCFNFSTLVDPTIEMKIWWNAEFSWDGAVLQSSIDGGTTWQNVGAMNDVNSTNWYNDNSLNGAPGGQPAASAQGWTGRVASSNGSNGWVLAKHALTGLGGQSNVKLRIAFGSDPSVMDEGFAFDDITIRETFNNVAVVSFAPFTKVCGFSTSETVTVTVKNLSNSVINNFPVNLLLNGTQVATQPVTALAANTTLDVIFNGINLSVAGQHTLRADAVLAADPEQANNTLTTTVTNSLFSAIPQGFNFEPTGQGLNALRSVTASKSAITESTDASSPLTLGSTKGIIMDAVTGSPWTLPILTVDPWTNNLNNKSGIYMCLPAQAGSDSLWLMFDLKQTFKDANANTNFRVTVNGTMVGTTYRPPVDGTPDVWKTVKVNLRSFKNAPIQIGLESSTKEAYQNGTGTANLVDNIIVRSRVITGSKDDILHGQLSVFPNPSKGQFNVSLPEGKTYDLEVADLTGRTLKKQTVKGGNSMLDMQGASQGIYLLKVKSDKGTAVRKLIIE